MSAVWVRIPLSSLVLSFLNSWITARLSSWKRCGAAFGEPPTSGAGWSLSRKSKLTPELGSNQGRFCVFHLAQKVWYNLMRVAILSDIHDNLPRLRRRCNTLRRHRRSSAAETSVHPSWPGNLASDSPNPFTWALVTMMATAS
jgi:hypothetical protein